MAQPDKIDAWSGEPESILSSTDSHPAQNAPFSDESNGNGTSLVSNVDQTHQASANPEIRDIGSISTTTQILPQTSEQTASTIDDRIGTSYDAMSSVSGNSRAHENVTEPAPAEFPQAQPEIVKYAQDPYKSTNAQSSHNPPVERSETTQRDQSDSTRSGLLIDPPVTTSYYNDTYTVPPTDRKAHVSAISEGSQVYKGDEANAIHRRSVGASPENNSSVPPMNSSPHTYSRRFSEHDSKDFQDVREGVHGLDASVARRASTGYSSSSPSYGMSGGAHSPYLYGSPSSAGTPAVVSASDSSHYGPSFPIQGPHSQISWKFQCNKTAVVVNMIKESSQHLNTFADFETLWDSQHLKMPCSHNNRCYSPKNVALPLSKWQYIKSKFQQPVNSTRHLETIIRSYNPTFQRTWPMFTLLHRLEQVDRAFVTVTLPYIIRMALSIENLFVEPPPLLRRQQSKEIVFSQKQCVSLVANMFLCTFPRRTPRHWSKLNEYAAFPNVGFDGLFSSDAAGPGFAKLQCIVAFFNFHCNNPDIDRPVSFRRQVLSGDRVPRWNICDAPLSLADAIANTAIEEMPKTWQADFANKIIGGGVLGRGAVQEEIRMAISPELLVSRLLCQELDPNEAVVMTGSQRYASYTGYAQSFQYAGPFEDKSVLRGEETTVVAFDALSYSVHDGLGNPMSQFNAPHTLRELEKAYVAFLPSTSEEMVLPIATGRWGCGAFKGNIYWKFLIQWLAASAAGRQMSFCTMNDNNLTSTLKHFIDVVNRAQPSRPTVADIYIAMSSFSPRAEDDNPLPYLLSRLGLQHRPSHQTKTKQAVHPTPRGRYGLPPSISPSNVPSSEQSYFPGTDAYNLEGDSKRAGEQARSGAPTKYGGPYLSGHGVHHAGYHGGYHGSKRDDNHGADHHYGASHRGQAHGVNTAANHHLRYTGSPAAAQHDSHIAYGGAYDHLYNVHGGHVRQGGSPHPQGIPQQHSGYEQQQLFENPFPSPYLSDPYNEPQIAHSSQHQSYEHLGTHTSLQPSTTHSTSQSSPQGRTHKSPFSLPPSYQEYLAPNNPTISYK